MRFNELSKMYGAGEGTQTLGLRLGKATLYQLSYTRIDCGRPGFNDQLPELQADFHEGEALTRYTKNRP
jgi:hypothetical protein